MPRAISVIYCFPRSGGTLLSQCLLTHPNNALLSEVNPAASVEEPEYQAAEWLRLLSGAEADAMRHRPYLERIAAIKTQADKSKRAFCIRDWSGVNFLPNVSPWVGQPSLQLEQRFYLKRGSFALREVALVRRSRAIFNSLRRNIPEFKSISPQEFAIAYQAYLKQIEGIAKWQLERLVEHPHRVIEAVCEDLRMSYASDFADKFHQIKNVTGNTTLLQTPESAAWTNIQNEASSRIAESASMPSADIFNQLDHSAGYEVTT